MIQSFLLCLVAVLVSTASSVALQSNSAQFHVQFIDNRVPPNPGYGGPIHAIQFEIAPNGDYRLSYSISGNGKQPGTKAEAKGVLTKMEQRQLVSAIKRSGLFRIDQARVNIPGGGIENGSSGSITISDDAGSHACEYHTDPTGTGDRHGRKLMPLINLLEKLAEDKRKTPR